jgi:ubiquinone/menaquinone biosynthesis C-methylase UbiE
MIALTWRRRLDQTRYVARQLSLMAPLVLFHRAVELLVDGGLDLPDAVSFRAIRERYEALLERDWQNVQQGLYPRGLLFQMPLASYARTLPSLFAEMARMGLRRAARNPRDLPAEVDLCRYPPYFRQTFHWQTDGYLSRRSAELYDLGVEILFLGTADVMRRQVIPPISRYVADRPRAEQRLLDVGCGTGRTLLQLAAALPNMRLVGVDLSPYYLQVARDLLARVPDVSLVADNAEQLPFVDRHFDVVTSVYLFHELPRAARRRVLAEARRVLRPGGLLVIEDSGQSAESPELAHFARWFRQHFHEPYIEDYHTDDLARVAQDAGFSVESVEPHFVSKVLVARRL